MIKIYKKLNNLNYVIMIYQKLFIKFNKIKMNNSLMINLSLNHYILIINFFNFLMIVKRLS